MREKFTGSIMFTLSLGTPTLIHTETALTTHPQRNRVEIHIDLSKCLHVVELRYMGNYNACNDHIFMIASGMNILP
jgi:hypothetical protein